MGVFNFYRRTESKDKPLNDEEEFNKLSEQCSSRMEKTPKEAFRMGIKDTAEGPVIVNITEESRKKSARYLTTITDNDVTDNILPDSDG